MTASRNAGAAVLSNSEPAVVGLAGDVEQILDRYDRSVERSERHAGLAPDIGGIGCCPPGFRIEFYEYAFIVRADGETRKDDFEAVAGRLHFRCRTPDACNVLQATTGA